MLPLIQKKWPPVCFGGHECFQYSSVEVDYRLIVIGWSIEAEEVHAGCWNGGDSEATVELCGVFSVVAWVIDDAWNRVQGVGSL